MAEYKIKDTGLLVGIVKFIIFYKELNIMDNLKIGKLAWVGHIIRMEDGRIPKYILSGKFHNT